MKKDKINIDESIKKNQNNLDEDQWDDVGSNQDIDANEDGSRGVSPEDAEGQTRRKRGRGANSIMASEDQKFRRLEKNRQSAKESRLRKKFYMQNLEEKNNQLEKEKAKLLRKINGLEERERMNYLSHVDTVDQLLQGR